MDLLIVVTSFVAVYGCASVLHLAGPGTYAVLFALGIVTLRLSIANENWIQLGFRMPSSLIRTAVCATALYLATAVLVSLIVNPLARAAGWPPVDLSRFAALRGDTVALSKWVLLAWTSAAFAEELVFRGFLISRMEMALGGGRAATAFAVVGEALLFGGAHFYLGARGIATAFAGGLLYGLVYVCNGRSLVPLIVTHGLTDTMSLLAIYSGAAAVMPRGP